MSILKEGKKNEVKNEETENRISEVRAAACPWHVYLFYIALRLLSNVPLRLYRS